MSDSEIKEALESLALSLAAQYKTNENLWAAIQALTAALIESLPGFREVIERCASEASGSDSVRQASEMLALVRKATGRE
jgi:hypothetical protein